MFGSHLSIAGGMHNAILEACRLELDAVQVFTKNQQQWKCKPLREDEVSQWQTHCTEAGFKKTVSHDSYLINLASPDEVMWQRSIELFAEELRRCATLGIPYLVTHPGAHMGTGDAAGLRRVAVALDRLHAEIPDGVITCLESTAGQGTSLGWRLEHLEEIFNLIAEPKRLGVCLDTAHLFAAGYDLRGRKYDAFRKELGRRIGVRNVRVWHLNDSKKELGSRVDRHEHIGLGKIGDAGFKPIVRDAAFAKVPKILETPKGDDDKKRPWDTVNVERLKGMM